MNRNFQFVVGYKRKININLITQTFDFSVESHNTTYDLDFHFPAVISNSIIEFNKNPSAEEIGKILLLFESLTCKHIVIIINSPINLQTLDDLFNCIQKRSIYEFTLISSFSEEVYTDSFVEKLALTNLTIPR